MASTLTGGSRVGTFVVGDGTKAGEPFVYHSDKVVLTLKGGPATGNVYTDFEQELAGKPKLLLLGKQITVASSSTLAMGKPKLLLNGKTVDAYVPDITPAGKPVLYLLGRSFVLKIDSTVSAGKPVLYLLGGAVEAGVRGLNPSVPVDVLLTPTTEEDLILVGSTPEDWLLVPTTEEFR